MSLNISKNTINAIASIIPADIPCTILPPFRIIKIHLIICSIATLSYTLNMCITIHGKRITAAIYIIVFTFKEHC